MKKICFVLGNVSGIGGTGRAVSILANKLCKEYNVSVVCYQQDLNKIGYQLDSRINVASVFATPRSMSIGMFAYIRYLCKYIKEKEIETLVVCGVLNMPGGIIAGKISGIKVVCCDHSNYTCVSDACFERQCRNFAARYSDYLITLTEKDLQNYRSNVKVRANIRAIPNIIDDELINKPHEEYDVNSHRIVSVGRLTYAKNYPLALNLAKLIGTQFPDWKWDIYGEGELRAVLEAQIREENITNVQLLGNVADMYDRYEKYSFLVMTSRYEGFPMVLIEAMAKGLPCIAFDCQTGPSDIILNGENGLLIEANDVAKMKDGIEKLITNPEVRLEMSGKTYRSVEKFKTSATIDKWKSIL